MRDHCMQRRFQWSRLWRVEAMRRRRLNWEVDNWEVAQPAELNWEVDSWEGVKWEVAQPAELNWEVDKQLGLKWEVAQAAGLNWEVDNWEVDKQLGLKPRGSGQLGFKPRVMIGGQRRGVARQGSQWRPRRRSRQSG